MDLFTKTHRNLFALPTVVFSRKLHGLFLRPFSCARYELLPLAALLSAMPMVLHTTQQVHRASL